MLQSPTRLAVRRVRARAREPRRPARRRSIRPVASSPAEAAPTRLRAPQELQVAEHRPRPRRPVDRRDRREGTSEGGVLRRRRRWALEDDRRRRELGAGHRRTDQERVRRRRRGVRVESRRRLHRHGRVVHSRQHHGGRRRLQVHRRRQDLDARWASTVAASRTSRRSASIRRTPTSCASRCSASTARLTTSAASSRRPTAARRGARCSIATTRPARSTSRSTARIPNVLYAAMWEAYRDEYQMSCGGPGSRTVQVHRRWRDAGQEITRNPGIAERASSGASASRCRARIRIACTRSSRTRTVGSSSSDDAGATWTLANGDRNIRQRAFYYTHVSADPKNKDVVYALNTSMFRSTDAGKTLTNVGEGTHGDHHDLWIDPDDPPHLVNGNDGGGAISTDGGKHWSAQDFPTAQFYHVDHDEARAVSRLRIAAGQQHGLRVERRARRLRRRWRRRRRREPALRRRRR